MSFAKRRGPLHACLNAKACCEASEPTTSADANAKACHVASAPVPSANANASRVASAPTTSADAIASCRGQKAARDLCSCKSQVVEAFVPTTAAK